MLELGDDIFILIKEDNAPLVVECYLEEKLGGILKTPNVGAQHEEVGF